MPTSLKVAQATSCCLRPTSDTPSFKSMSGAFLAFGGQTAHASTIVGGGPVTLITTYESFLGDIRYDCSLYAMGEMLQSDATEALEMLSSSEGNLSESCGYLAGYGNFGFGFIV